MVEPVRNQNHDPILRAGLEPGEYLVLRPPIQRRKRIIQHEHRAGMRQRPRQRQPLRLPAGEPNAAAPHDGLKPLLHRPHLAVQRGQGEKAHRVARLAAEHVFLHGIVPKLRIMAEIADRRGRLARRKLG